MGIHRSVSRYRRVGSETPELRKRPRTLAAERRRFGYRRLWVLLRREGFGVNHKRVYRLYREEGLSVRRRKRKRMAGIARVPTMEPERPNQRWSMDFVSDALASGRRIRVLTVIDDFTRESLAMEVDTSLPGLRVTRVLDRLAIDRGLPGLITVDNGPEFAGRVLDAWAHAHGVHLHFIGPGKPVQNAYIESFNGRLRDESRVPGSGVRGRGSGERETTASSLAGKHEAREKEDNGGQGKDGPAGAVAQGGNGR